VANRTGQRATTLAGEIGGQAVPFSRLAWALAESDIVISGTGSVEFILGPELISSVVANRDGRELVLIDIAVPRDVDPVVGQLPGVRLFDIDDIQAVSRAGMRGRRRQILRVEAHVEDEVDDFMEWWRSLDVLPVIAALRERAEDARRRELERTLRALPDLDDEQKARIKAMSRAMVKKMLDLPIARLKNGASTGTYVDAMRDLFGARRRPSRERR
jgi:glutamyl-tRNA reductase